jgi:hypothetical protein
MTARASLIRIRGTVNDSSGAVMQDVKVTVTDVGREQFLTNEDGLYSFPP